MSDLGDEIQREALDPNILNLPDGLCGNRADHSPHMVLRSSVGMFWCSADQSQREPFRSEQKRKAEK